MLRLLAMTIYLFSLGSSPAQAVAIEYKTHSFSIDFPKGWKEVRDFFGVPVSILGPFQTNQSRPVIQIVPTTQKAIEFTSAEVAKWNENHKANTEKWMSKHGGRLQSLVPGVVEVRKDGTRQLVGGLLYQLHAKSFIEKIYYISCPKGLYNIKILVNQGSKEFLQSAEKIVGSFKCGK